MLKITACAVIVFCLMPLVFFGQLRLPALIRDSMVVQRDAKIKLWGWAAAGEKIKLQFNGKKASTTTGADGKWMLFLPPMKAGGPFAMTITAGKQVTLKDILIGDVWICSGQSNMVHQMALHNIRYADEIAAANYPEIRQFYVPTLTDLQGPRGDLPAGNWKSANPQDINRFSAVAYFFAKTIYEKYHVPIGLINASVGGTPIEAWTSEEGLRSFSAIDKTVQKNKDTAFINGINNRAAAAAANKPMQQDKGLMEAPKWFDNGYIPKNWRTINIPGYWEDQGIKDMDGVVWYRREIEVPASMTGIPATLFLGRIVDADYVYINGIAAGNTGYQYPQRRYALPAGLLRPGKNIFVVRVVNNAGKGGFVPDKPYYLAAGGQTIDIKGEWFYRVGEVFDPHRESVAGISLQNQPTALFNAMIAPVINYSIKGFLWYQGESNAGKAAAYTDLLPALVADWRHQWKQGDLPFLYVQLPNFMEAAYLPAESQWAMLREAQLKALRLPNTGMAVAIDLGEWNDIHPDNKKDVGTRLALAAEKIAYSEKDLVYSGPLFETAVVAGNKITIHFTNTGTGLVSNDGEPLSQFAIAGADKKFVWAKAVIEGDNVIVWNDAVAQPLYVRYAWADNPAGANLYNKEGLPASPFRTDSTASKGE